MADPVTILCSILTIADASKKVLDVCTEYVTHAKNAPKELQTVIEDVHALNGTMKRLDKLAKSARRTHRNANQFDQWNLPLTHIKQHAQDLVQLISQQDMKIGLFHEIKFRARWSHHWLVADNLLRNIRLEKNELQLATNVYGAEMVGMLFEIVDERLPRDRPVEPPRDSDNASSMHWKKVDQTYCSPDQRQIFILKELGDLIGWDLATYEYSQFDDTHQYNVHHSAGYAEEMFLNSEIYQAWKNRKTRGPGLLCGTGSATTGKITLCCRVIQDLQNSNNGDVGITYYYFGLPNDFTPFAVIRVLQFWVIQLALQCKCLASRLLAEKSTFLKDCKLPGLDGKSYSKWKAYLQSILASLFTQFRRTFLIIDALDKSRDEDVERVAQEILEQDFGNVSIAIFSESFDNLEPLLQVADVSIRLTQLEPDLHEYVRLMVIQKVKPMLAAAGLDHDDDSLATIKRVMTEASAGLYLGVDVLINSLMATIRANRDVAAFLRQTREGNEIMLQRDPESMKQKAFGIETRNPVTQEAGPSKYLYRQL